MARNISQSPRNKAGSAYHHGNLAEAACTAGLKLLEEQGAHSFTLAEVASRIGVSTAALYRHYADRDAFLASLAIECFRSFESRLRRAGAKAVGMKRLNAMTLAYLSFAERHGQRYALMFSAHLDQNKYAQLEVAGDEAFAVLMEALRDPQLRIAPREVQAAAVQVWAHCHGLAALKAGWALEVDNRELGQLALAGVGAIVAQYSR